MKIASIGTAIVLAFGVLPSTAMAQMAPATGSAMAIPAADMKKITRCNAMKHDAMMKSAMCMKMMKMYPTSFNAGSAATN